MLFVIQLEAGMWVPVRAKIPPPTLEGQVLGNSAVSKGRPSSSIELAALQESSPTNACPIMGNNRIHETHRWLQALDELFNRMRIDCAPTVRRIARKSSVRHLAARRLDAQGTTAPGGSVIDQVAGLDAHHGAGHKNRSAQETEIALESAILDAQEPRRNTQACTPRMAPLIGVAVLNDKAIQHRGCLRTERYALREHHMISVVLADSWNPQITTQDCGNKLSPR